MIQSANVWLTLYMVEEGIGLCSLYFFDLRRCIACKGVCTCIAFKIAFYNHRGREKFSLIFGFQFKGIISIVGAVAVDMGVLTTPQLHWMVRARNKAMNTTELDYFNQLSSWFRFIEASCIYSHSVCLNEFY